VKLFKLETPNLWLPEEINMMLVRADDEAAARNAARDFACGRGATPTKFNGRDRYVEAWLDPEQCDCEEVGATGDTEVVYYATGYN
jgi:hypothetical protein